PQPDRPVRSSVAAGRARLLAPRPTMARFEVFIPAAEQGSFDVTLRVDAPNWMQALKTGFHRLGEQGPRPHNLPGGRPDDRAAHGGGAPPLRRVGRGGGAGEGGDPGPPPRRPGGAAGAGAPPAAPVVGAPVTRAGGSGVAVGGDRGGGEGPASDIGPGRPAA